MSEQIAKYEAKQVLRLEEIQGLGKIFKASGLFSDIQSEAQAVVKILAGQEMGISPMLSMQGINIIKGKVCLSANLMAHLIKKSGKYNYKVLEHTDKICEIAFLEEGNEVGVSSFSMEDAQRAGLPSKDVWKMYPRNLLFARALSNGVRWYCPDLGLQYTQEEMEEEVVEKKTEGRSEARIDKGVSLYVDTDEPEKIEEVEKVIDEGAEKQKKQETETEKRARLTKAIHAATTRIFKEKFGIKDTKRITELYKLTLKNCYQTNSCKDMTDDFLQSAVNWYSDIANCDETVGKTEIKKLLQIEGENL
ncbi:MAG: hypothetical protein DDT23_01019 [candidate division WS2 bacterium]|nr:hypothetical protein [Candidatus Lithacetigena glycinireducens]